MTQNQANMSALPTSKKFTAFFQRAKPWITTLVILLILHFTGVLTGMVGLTQRALLLTGIHDANGTEETTRAESFNYNFKVKDLEGKVYNFSDYKGKVVFLNLWATWCGPCRAEMPGIQNLYTKISNQNISFVMLSVDEEGQQQKIKKYISDKKFTFPVFMPSGKLTPQLSVPSIPTTFVIDKDGKVVQKKTGTTNFDTPSFKKYLENLADQ